ncbi:DUF1275 domain-containing protein [Lachnospiraceae bacterium NSJ-143]|nr:DUF1275 domain-containing protein [Lachnospiraceae bacterium NSJ-143]
MKINGQMSESIPLGFILVFSGGFMDAYTYMCRGGVFANAQTGNILLFGVNISKGNISDSLRYLFPVLMFTAGIFISECVKNRHKFNRNIHWRQITTLLEAFILFAVMFIPQNLNIIANSLVSFACGIQVESFRKINGTGFATTMCIGNLRTATEAVSNYFFTGDKQMKAKSLLIYSVIAVFIVGAVCGNFAVEMYKERAIFISSMLMAVCFLLMFLKGDTQ